MSTWNWKRGLLGAGFVLAGGCNLGDLVDEDAFLDKFKGIQIPQAGIDEVTKKIGAEGGQAVTMDGAVNIPEGALTEDVDITVEQADPEVIVAPLPSVMKPVSAPVSFKPDGTEFAEPVTLTLFHNKAAAEPEQPVVVWLENEKDPNWKTVKSEDTHTDGPATYVSTTHFSVYAVVDCVAAGPLAHLCQDLIDGKITIQDVLEMAPPSEDTWGGVVDPRPIDSQPDAGTGPGTTDGYDCRRCLDIAQKCQQDPRQDICEDAAEPCSKLAPQCAEQLTCSQLQLACDHDQPAACDEFDRRCTDGPALGRCDQLSIDCDRGNQGACDAYDRECPTGGIPDCAKLEAQCDGGDQIACQDHYYYCSDATDDPCTLASNLCAQQDQHACDLHQYYCVEGNEPASTCQSYADACYVGVSDSCSFNDAYCYGSELQCESVYTGCYENGDSDACDAYYDDCVQVEPDPCYDAEENCRLYQTVEDCTYHEQYCQGGGSSDGGTEDCYAQYGEQCFGPEASVDACYAYDACMGYDSDGSCHYERFCYPAGCSGEGLEEVCWPEDCHVQTVCDEPPPPEVCEPLWDDCFMNDNQSACDEAESLNCPPRPATEPGDAGVPPDCFGDCTQLAAQCDLNSICCDEWYYQCAP
jgi:hypothetical protein